VDEPDTGRLSVGDQEVAKLTKQFLAIEDRKAVKATATRRDKVASEKGTARAVRVFRLSRMAEAGNTRPHPPRRRICCMVAVPLLIPCLPVRRRLRQQVAHSVEEALELSIQNRIAQVTALAMCFTEKGLAC